MTITANQLVFVDPNPARHGEPGTVVALAMRGTSQGHRLAGARAWPGGWLGWRGRCRPPAARSVPGRVWCAVVAAVTAVALTGCGDTAPPAGGGRSGTPVLSAPPQSARSAAEADALAAWRGMWQAYAEAGLTANPTDPDLSRYARGRALAILTAGLKSYKDKRQILKGELVTDPRVSKASPDAAPTTVTITDCVDDSRFLVYKASGGLLNDIPGGRRAALATVTKDAGGWKVSSFGVQEPGTC